MSHDGFFCPIPICSLSLEAGKKRRLCCHDHTNETIDYDPKDVSHGLVNSDFSKKILNAFDNGHIPENCKHCYLLENKDILSPRLEYLKKFSHISSAHNNKNIEYLDITIDNDCNLKCRSCKPAYSKGLIEDFTKLEIPFNQKTIRSINKFKSNEFHHLIPLLSEEAYITITGGEPFLSKKTLSFIEDLIKKRKTKKMNLRFFTNLTVIPKWFDLILVNFKTVEILASIDAVDELTNYIRYPSKWLNISNNLKLLTTLTKKTEHLSIKIHTVIQAYNMNSISIILDRLKDFELEIPFVPEFTLLEHPNLLSAEIIPSRTLNKIVTDQIIQINDINKNIVNNRFKVENQINLEQLKRILESLIGSENDFKLMKFLIHTRKFDKLRKQNIYNFMPELAKLEK